jgi:hypothetical protein
MEVKQNKIGRIIRLIVLFIFSICSIIFNHIFNGIAMLIFLLCWIAYIIILIAKFPSDFSEPLIKIGRKIKNKETNDIKEPN